jgi:hypothetical protein
MRRKILFVSLIIIFVLGCQIGTAAVPTRTPLPLTVTPTTTITPTTTPEATPTVTDVEFDVRVHPDDGLFVGDQLSFEVIAPPGMSINDEENLEVTTESGEIIGSTGFAPFGIGNRQQATLRWTWDTSNLQPGPHEVTFAIPSQNLRWTETIALRPRSELAAWQREADWAVTESECCRFYYITNTASERDKIDWLFGAQEQAEQVATLMDTTFTQPVEITLMPRVLGHGGFASGEIYISYLDRNYAGSAFDFVLHHEMVHILDARLGGELRPSILAEGLAVYLTGGHFKPEPLIPRAAALLELTHPETGLNWYLPLRPLTDNFYTSQHEIGYLQAGALVEYMVETWGWEAFWRFYRGIKPAADGTHSQAIENALQEHFDLSLARLEARFLERLRAEEVTPENKQDVRLVVSYYDNVRRYQQILDPSAYFLAAWLPRGPEMRQRGIVADLLRHPSETENLIFETMLVAVDQHLRAARYDEAETTLEAVEAALDALEAGQAKPFQAHLLAANHEAIVRLLLEQGYHPQQIMVQGQQATAEVSQDGQDLESLQLSRVQGVWRIDLE